MNRHSVRFVFLIIQFESLQETRRKPVRAKLLKSATLREKKDVRRDLKIERAGKRKFADKKRTRRAEGESKGEETPTRVKIGERKRKRTKGKSQQKNDFHRRNP